MANNGPSWYTIIWHGNYGYGYRSEPQGSYVQANTPEQAIEIWEHNKSDDNGDWDFIFDGQCWHQLGHIEFDEVRNGD